MNQITKLKAECEVHMKKMGEFKIDLKKIFAELEATTDLNYANQQYFERLIMKTIANLGIKMRKSNVPLSDNKFKSMNIISSNLHEIAKLHFTKNKQSSQETTKDNEGFWGIIITLFRTVLGKK